MHVDGFFKFSYVLGDGLQLTILLQAGYMFLYLLWDFPISAGPCSAVTGRLVNRQLLSAPHGPRYCL